MNRAELETLDREDLIARAEAAGVARARILTRPELVDELLIRSAADHARKQRSRGFFGLARDLLARVVERGLHLPDAADRIRTLGALPAAKRSAPRGSADRHAGRDLRRAGASRARSRYARERPGARAGSRGRTRSARAAERLHVPRPAAEAPAGRGGGRGAAPCRCRRPGRIWGRTLRAARQSRPTCWTTRRCPRGTTSTSASRSRSTRRRCTSIGRSATARSSTCTRRGPGAPSPCASSS